MPVTPSLEQIAPFEIRTSPAPAELGHGLQNRARRRETLLQLRFGEQVASFAVDDLWSACCELLLDAQLVREARLNHFVLDVEQIFDLSYEGDLLLCIFSQEHIFAVRRDEVAAALERLVEEIFAATSCPRLMMIAARWGASSIRGLPYSIRFSDSALT